MLILLRSEGPAPMTNARPDPLALSARVIRLLTWLNLLMGIGILGLLVASLVAAGPVMALFLMAQKVDKQVFVATNAVFFTLNNLFKLPPYVASGLITGETLKADLRFIPFIPVGVAVGWGLNRVMPQKAFVYLVYGLLILTSLHLLRG